MIHNYAIKQASNAPYISACPWCLYV